MYTSNNRLLRFYQYAKQEKIAWARWSKAKREKKEKSKAWIKKIDAKLCGIKC